MLSKRFAIPLILLTLFLLPWKGSAQIYADVSVSGAVSGTFTISFYYQPAQAPVAVANFIGLATGQKGWVDYLTGNLRYDPFYNGLTWHRVIAGDFSQTGSRSGDGTDSPGYSFQNETGDVLLSHTTAYTVAMANTGGSNSNGAQWYITSGSIGTAEAQSLNGNYTIFGHVISGTSVCEAINSLPTNGPDGYPANQPITPEYIDTVKVYGPSLSTFNLTPNGLPVAYSANPVMKVSGSSYSLDFDYAAQSYYIGYDTPDLNNWTNWLYEPLPSGTIDVTPFINVSVTGSGSSTLSGSGSVEGNASVTGSATVTGTGAITGIVTAVRKGSYTVTGTGTSTGSAVVTGSGSGTGQGSITAPGMVTLTGTVTASGGFSATGISTVTGSSTTISGTGTVSGAGTVEGTGTVTGTGTGTGNGIAILSSTATVTGTTTVTGTGTFTGTGTITGTGTMTGNPSVTGSASKYFFRMVRVDYSKATATPFSIVGSTLVFSSTSNPLGGTLVATTGTTGTWTFKNGGGTSVAPYISYTLSDPWTPTLEFQTSQGYLFDFTSLVFTTGSTGTYSGQTNIEYDGQVWNNVSGTFKASH